MGMKKEKGWFRRTFMEEENYEKKAREAFRKQQDELAKKGEIISKLPPYIGFDGWQETHKGYRMQRLASAVRKNVVALVAGLLVIATLGLLCMAYVSATLFYNAATDTMEKIPDPTSLLFSAFTGVGAMVFTGGSGLTVKYYGSIFDKFYDNSKVYDIHAKNFLNERWHIKLYNGYDPELEPIGKAVLKQQKVDVEKELKKTEAELKKTSVVVDGKPLDEAELAARKILLQGELEKYRTTLTRINACLEDRMTICSIESRDHEYVWKHHIVNYTEKGTPKKRLHGVLEKEIGWKLYLAVPGPNLVSCTGKDELLTDIGFKDKLLDNYQFAACVDLPTHPDIVEDDVTHSAVIVDIPILGVRDTPNGGAYYDWDKASGLLVSRLLNYPMYTAVKSESDLKDAIIANQEQQIQNLSLEGAVVQVPELLKRLGLAVNLNEIIPMTQPTNEQPIEPAKPVEVKANNSLGKTALIASACVALIGLGGFGIVALLSSIL